MVKGAYIPALGDIIWLNFDPQVGREQAGKRPALVLSPQSYNKLIGLAIVCPITKRVKGYPFEVQIQGQRISGAVLADHVKSVDWKGRRASLIEPASAEAVLNVTVKLHALLPRTSCP